MRINIFNPFNNNGITPKSNIVQVAPGVYCQNDPRVIANWKNSFDKDGKFLNSEGIAGMDITGKDPSEWHKTIKISDEGKQKLFDMVKSEFIENNGVLNGDTSKRSKVFSDYYRTIPASDRLNASWSLQQLEQEYRDTLLSVAKKDNPNWEIGNQLKPCVLDDVTRTQGSKGIDIFI